MKRLHHALMRGGGATQHLEHLLLESCLQGYFRPSESLTQSLAQPCQLCLHRFRILHAQFACLHDAAQPVLA